MTRFLGDVPGLDDLLPNSAVLPTGYSVSEVNSLGEVTADMAGIGDGLTGMGTGDPFAYNIGFADEEQEGEGSEGHVAQHDPMQSSYLPTYDDGSTPTYSGVGGFDAEQVENAEIIASVGKKLGASERDVQIALMAGIVESGLRSLEYGDRDSIGIFQQRDAWGSRETRLNPAKAAALFFLGGAGGQEGLLDIKDRDSRPMGEVAQDVQVSAYPERYAEHETEAAQLIAAMSGDTTTGKVGKNPYGLTSWDGETVDNVTAAALKAATKEFGSNFSIMQGSHSHDVAASGGTHDGGGVVDLSVPNGDWAGAMTALRKIGFAAWVRNVPGYGSAGSGAHIHAVLIGNERLSPQAQTQVQSYLNNDDGLSGSRPDDGPRDFVNNRFVWGARQKQGPTWRDEVANLAKQFLGAEFKWGGKDFDGVDYEGLVRGIYSKVGLDVPDLADDIARLSDPVDVTDARKGDLIGWDEGGDLRFGIYLGNGRFIEAGGPGRVVQINDLGAAALNAFGIPLEQILNKPKAPGLARPAPAPTYAPPTPSYGGAPPAGSGQGQANAPVEQAPSRGPRPNRNGPLQDTTFDQKPHLLP